MGPKCAVSVDKAVFVIKQYKEHFCTNQLPAWSSQVWTDMSKALDGKWNPGCVYTNVVKDRRSILSLARQEMGWDLPLNRDLKNISPEELTSSDTEQESDGESSNSSFNSANTEKLDSFDLILSEEDWNNMKPQDADNFVHSRIKLKPKVWANIIAEEFWRQHRHPCAFVFKRADVSKCQDQLSYSIKIVGSCKSVKCSNTFEGHAQKVIDKKGITFKIKTRDTRGETHELVKRPFNGERRKEALKELKAVGSIGWRKREALRTMRPGDTEAPTLPNDHVLRQARKQGIDEELGIVKDARDLIKTLEEMALTQYSDLIHEVASFPFRVCYSSPAQLHTYKEYHRLSKEKSTIVIDATGRLVKVLERINGTKSGHVFLYAIVFNFDGTTVATHHMLSECHDTVTIMCWILKWLQRGAPKPKQAISDYSRSLLAAMSMAFNNQPIKEYVVDRFRLVSNYSGITKKPPTIIRVDVAHLIHFICRWKCFKSIRQKPIKDFFVRCVALMVECQTLIEFEEIFILTCAIGAQSHEDATIEISDAKTPKEARRKLEQLISVGHINDKSIEIDDEKSSPRQQAGRFWDIDEEIEPEKHSDISQFIENLLSKARNTLAPGSNLNPFFLPDFITPLARLAKEFPLWTAVGMPANTKRASSSCVEAYFGDLKTRTFMGHSLPIRLDKFIAIHAKDIAGSNVLMASKIVQYNAERRHEGTATVKSREDVLETLPEQVEDDEVKLLISQNVNDSDLDAYENWRGKAVVPIYADDVFTTINGLIDTDVQGEATDNTDVLICRDIQNQDQSKVDISVDHPYAKSEIIQDNEEQISYAKFESCLNAPADKVSTPTRLVPLPPKEEEKKRSKYFKPYPEIRQNNALAATKNPAMRRAALLRNGSFYYKGVKIAGCSYFLKNTCPFDSLVQILATAALDDIEYLQLLERSDNRTLQFVSNLVENGVTTDLLVQRAQILRDLLKPRITGTFKNRPLCYEINAEDNIANVVKCFLSSNPSVIVTELCSRCGQRTIPQITIAPNHKIIATEGFKALQTALQFQSPVLGLVCREGCPGTFTRTSVPTEHIFIELDIRDTRDLQKSLTCSLGDFPRELHLGQMGANNSVYRLAGVVQHLPGHYIAHCRRIAGSWQCFNDMARAVTSSNSRTHIEPHLAVYIREEQRSPEDIPGELARQGGGY